MTFTLGSYMPHRENFTTEYKEFCMKDNIYKYLTDKQVSKMVRHGKMSRKMNQIVMLNLCKYFDIYVPKYVSSFHNSNELKNRSDMKFMIGINDYAEITGIPYLGKNMNDDKIYLQRCISNTLKNNLTDICCLSVDLNIHECAIDTQLVDDEPLSELLRRQDKQQLWYNTRYRKYNKKRKKWIRSVMKYKGKLQEVLEDPICKEELRDYLSEHNKLEEYEWYLDNYYEINVDNIKYDKKNTGCFVYWLIKYKDDKVQELMNSKPKAPMIPRINNVEYSASTTLSCLRSRLIKNNKNIKYYVLIVTISKNDKCEKTLKYCDERKNWRNIERRLHDDESPYSIDV